MCAGRNSLGFELEDAFLEVFDDRIDDVPALSRSVGRTRLERHRAFVERRREDGHAFEYEADHYETPVMTDMERGIRLREARAIEDRDDGYLVEHDPLVLE